MLKQFRKDTDFSTSSFYEFSLTLKTTVSLVINKKDIFTLNYAQAGKIWGRYFECIDKIYFIDSDSHYFQKDNSDELVQLIFNDK